MLGPLLTLMGMKPVKFQSESDFAKSISTESKVFSIYAVGVVKGYKRETRVKIHTVVDFRAAPSLTGSAADDPTSTARTPAAAAPSGQQVAASASSSGAIAAALRAERRRAGPLLQHRVRRDIERKACRPGWASTSVARA